MLNWYKSESTIRPELIDTTSSNIVVYLRRNIIEKQFKNEVTGQVDDIMYEYDEAILSKAEYKEYKENLEFQSAIELKDEMDVLKEKNTKLQNQVKLLTECILEMSEVVYM